VFSFAFLDFHSPQEATKTLVNRKNHFFSGRKLNLQVSPISVMLLCLFETDRPC
jgi:hypothetical protein